ncbi:MAG: PSD1 and planctomycete cytochrome C domain-containing protein [Planctomycetaceae bacterium]
MPKPVVTLLLIACSISLPALAQESSPAESAADNAARERFFETTIRPLLHAKCVKCHGENKQESGLRLDSLEGLLQGGDSGAAATPGQPTESLLLQAVRYESLQMPPDDPLTAEQIANLERWIADGAAWPVVDGKSVRLEGAAFTEEERGFWSLQPVVQPTVPDAGSGWSRTDVDSFVAARLQHSGIVPAPRATPRELVRRLYFDVLGVPPTPEEVAELSDANFDTVWPQLVDRLLADPRYGEHWGRHWLDVVRYAESDGFRADFYRPTAWRYRDYVVNSFNDDKPYDEFVREQIAGDEIAPDRADALVATGFLRTYLYEYNQRDARTQWQDILNQITDVTGEAFLGVGIACARCHDHKFDPILQADYFRMQAAFGSVIPRDDIPAADRDARDRYDAEYAAWLAKGTEIRAEIDAVWKPYLQKAWNIAVPKFTEDIQALYAKAPADRTPLEQQISDLVKRQVDFEIERMKFSDNDKKKLEELEARLKEVAGDAPLKLPTAFTIADVSAVPAQIHLAADPKRRVIPAGGFTIITPQPFDPKPLADSTGQRTALADWIVRPDNPLTSRVIVNRIWQQHFGTGIVETASDFGSLGGEPTHPELLDWLASSLVQNGWRIKWLHRQILNSATWQMSSFHPDAQAAEHIDPGNRLRWRFRIRRLAAEQIRDAMLSVSGELLSEQGGPSVEQTSLRRSLDLRAIRNRPERLLKSLDGVDGLNSIPKRSVTTTPTQALQLMNGEWARARAAAMAGRVLDETNSDDPAVVIARAFQLAYDRPPTADETSLATEMLAQLRTASGSSDANADANADAAAPLESPLADLCHVLLNSNEFVYVD